MQRSLDAVPGRRERQREATREAVYRAAIAEFERRGVAAAQVRDIARAAGVAYGTFYSHFENKRAVLLESSRRTAERVRARLAAQPAERYASAEEFFLAVARTHAAAEPDGAGLRADVWQAAASQTPRFETHPHVDALAEHVAALQQRGVIRDDESAHAIAGVFLTGLIGFLVQAPSRDDESLTLLARLYAAGCEPPGARAERG